MKKYSALFVFIVSMGAISYGAKQGAQPMGRPFASRGQPPLLTATQLTAIEVKDPVALIEAFNKTPTTNAQEWIGKVVDETAIEDWQQGIFATNKHELVIVKTDAGKLKYGIALRSSQTPDEETKGIQPGSMQVWVQTGSTEVTLYDPSKIYHLVLEPTYYESED